MLIKEVVREYGAKVRYADENFGDSKIAERFGVRRYPAVFVDDALVARPQDFYLWEKTRSGRYTPWLEAESHDRFQRDLRRMIELRLRGDTLESLAVDAESEDEVRTLPELELVALDGREIATVELRGRHVLVELWAVWCPPCLTTLSWLKEIDERYGDRLTVLAVAVASEEEQVRELVAARQLLFPVILGSDEVVAELGNVMAVPTLYVFDREGRNAGVFYGAPADLHERVERLIKSLP